MKKGRHKNSVFTRLLAQINAFFALLLLLSYLVPYIAPDSLWPFGFLGLAYPLLLLINGIFLVAWIVLKKRFVLMPLLVILAGWNHVGNHMQLIPSSKKEMPGQITLMSYNTQLTKHNDKEDNAGNVVSLIDSVVPDIICLQEFYYAGETMQTIRENIEALAGYTVVNEKKGTNLLTYTHYRSANEGFLNAYGNTFALFSDIIAGNDTLRVYNIQLASNHLADEKTLFDEQPDWSKKQSQQRATNIVRKLIKGYKGRVREVAILQEHLKQSPHPVVICGDFNDTPLSFSYHQIKGKRLQDAFKKSSTIGMSNTHNENLPPIRIDYILHDKSYETLFYERMDKTFSDHFAIVATIGKQ